MKIEIGSEIAPEVYEALTRQADSYTDTLDAIEDGKVDELEHDVDELEWVVDELRLLADLIHDHWRTARGHPLST